MYKRQLLPDSIELDATGVMVNDDLPAGLTYLSSMSTNGSYDPATGDWDIGFLRNGRIDTLYIETRIDTTAVITNLAEVTQHNENDLDSDPDNAGTAPTEDDEAMTTLSTGRFDLALRKEVLSPGPYFGGDALVLKLRYLTKVVLMLRILLSMITFHPNCNCQMLIGTN